MPAAVIKKFPSLLVLFPTVSTHHHIFLAPSPLQPPVLSGHFPRVQWPIYYYLFLPRENSYRITARLNRPFSKTVEFQPFRYKISRENVS